MRSILRFPASCMMVGTLLSACLDAPIPNSRYELHLRLVRHQPTVPNLTAADIPVANAVWQFGTVEIYDSLNLLTAVRLPDDTCGLEVRAVMTDVTSQLLSNDSVLILFEVSWTNELVTSADAVGYFNPFAPLLPTADTVPVFVVPYLGLRFPDGSINLGVFGYAPWVGVLAPSVWLASRLIDQFQYPSLLAHELGHLLVRQPPLSPFGDTSTAFVNIMQYPGIGYKYRRQPEGFGLNLEQVLVDEVNRRQLVEVSGYNMCRDALRPADNVLRIDRIP